MRQSLRISSEDLAYWYFRLNGCLTTQNFVVHPDTGRDQMTDVDMIAVRFPFRAELLLHPMQDDQVLLSDRRRIRIFLVEVKRSRCELNGPWIDPQRKNMQRVVRAIGALPNDMTRKVATSLYEEGSYKDSLFNISLFCIGSSANADLEARFPSVTQLTWRRVMEFIFERFRGYRFQKVSHPQWDDTGKSLWDHAMRCTEIERFANSIQLI